MVRNHRRWNWLTHMVYKRFREELTKLDVTLNLEKTRKVDLKKNETFSFLGFVFRRVKTLRGKWA